MSISWFGALRGRGDTLLSNWLDPEERLPELDRGGICDQHLGNLARRLGLDLVHSCR
jgi:hypothetical protein